MLEVGSKIRELRQSKKMSQKELAVILNVTPQAVSKWELDKSLPDLETVVALCDHFQISVDELLGKSKQTFFESLFSKKRGSKTMKQEQRSVTLKAGEIPKAVQVELAATFMIIQFNTGETRYLRTTYNKKMVEAFSPEKSEGNRVLKLWAYNSTNWLGTKVEIKSDGTVVLNEHDEYTPEELWENSREHIHEL